MSYQNHRHGKPRKRKRTRIFQRRFGLTSKCLQLESNLKFNPQNDIHRPLSEGITDCEGMTNLGCHPPDVSLGIKLSMLAGWFWTDPKSSIDDRSLSLGSPPNYRPFCNHGAPYDDSMALSATPLMRNLRIPSPMKVPQVGRWGGVTDITRHVDMSC